MSFGDNSATLMVGLMLTLVVMQVSSYDWNEDTRGQCYVNGNVYTHGQIFTIPGFSHCIRYRCNNGAWGPFEEACEHNGRCHPVGSYYDDACTTYTCTRSSQNGYTYYQPVRTRTRCQDYYGTCHDSGSQFSYAINGRLYQHCSCTARSDGFVSYRCSGK
ncbi:hypothetical protein BsWGS_03422 [Bradybaena similaris]